MVKPFLKSPASVTSTYMAREDHKGSMASVAFHLNNQLNAGENPKLFAGSESFKRDFVYVGDVCKVNLWFLENGVSGIFNCGTGRAESFEEVAKAVIAHHGKGEIETIPFPEHLKVPIKSSRKQTLPSYALPVAMLSSRRLQKALPNT